MAGNIANIKIDDACKKKYELEMKKKSTSKYKCLCMKLDDKFSTVELDNDRHIEREDENNLKDIKTETTARVEYEKKLFTDFCNELGSLKKPDARFFVWDFVFLTNSGQENSKTALLSWVPDDGPSKAKLSAASVKEVLRTNLDISKAFHMSDTSDIDYDDFVKSIRGT